MDSLMLKLPNELFGMVTGAYAATVPLHELFRARVVCRTSKSLSCLNRGYDCDVPVTLKLCTNYINGRTKPFVIAPF
jgi:hypothetical protein